MRSIFPTFAAVVVFLTMLHNHVTAQTDPSLVFVDAKVISAPTPKLPPEAKKSGLGGAVSVLTKVDTSGKVVSVKEVRGPGSVCPAVARPDVVALRKGAKAAALKARVSPSTKGGVAVASDLWMKFEFASTNDDGRFDETLSGGVGSEGGGKSTGVDSKGSDEPPTKMLMTSNPNAVRSTKDELGTEYNSMSDQTISGGVLNGKAFKLSKPTYPAAARAIKVYGSVGVQVLIETDGTIFSARAVSGHPLLRHSSEIAACDSQFTPTLLMGEPVKVSGIITYNYVP